MNRIAALLSFILAVSYGTIAISQTVVKRVESGSGGKDGKRMVVKDGDMFNLPEVGGLILNQGGKLVVMDLLDATNRPKGYENVDLKKDDIIQMVEGKPVKTITDLKAAYEKTAIGSPFRMGVVRGSQMMIVALQKGDPEKMPKIRRMIMNDDGKGPHEPGGVQRQIALRAAGLVLTEKGKDIVVADLLDNPSPTVKKEGIAKGDKVVALDGKKLPSMEQFTDALQKIEPGTKVTLDIMHKGKIVTIDFVRGGGNARKETKD